MGNPSSLTPYHISLLVIGVIAPSGIYLSSRASQDPVTGKLAYSTFSVLAAVEVGKLIVCHILESLGYGKVPEDEDSKAGAGGRDSKSTDGMLNKDGRSEDIELRETIGGEDALSPASTGSRALERVEEGLAGFHE